MILNSQSLACSRRRSCGSAHRWGRRWACRSHSWASGCRRGSPWRSRGEASPRTWCWCPRAGSERRKASKFSVRDFHQKTVHGIDALIHHDAFPLWLSIRGSINDNVSVMRSGNIELGLGHSLAVNRLVCLNPRIKISSSVSGICIDNDVQGILVYRTQINSSDGLTDCMTIDWL